MLQIYIEEEWCSTFSKNLINMRGRCRSVTNGWQKGKEKLLDVDHGV
jgi:hypothetical protein